MKAVTKVVGRFADLENQFPLTHLDGLNMWYEARLVEEGVEDLENLATADIVDLLLATRVPVGRTVDWIDQAFLYLRVTGSEQRRSLRGLGIRTATDLQDVFSADIPAASRRSRAELVAGVLYPEGVADPLSALEIVLATLQGEANLRHVRAWWSVTGPTTGREVGHDQRRHGHRRRGSPRRAARPLDGQQAICGLKR